MSMADVSDAFWDWTSPIQFLVVQTTIADYEVSENPINAVVFDGVLEPINPRKLLVKPENQRTWRWWTIFTEFKLEPGQVVQDPEGFQYRIMSINDWRRAGYFEYEAVQAPSLKAAPPVPA